MHTKLGDYDDTVKLCQTMKVRENQTKESPMQNVGLGKIQNVDSTLYTLFKKTVKTVFVITMSNFHQF